MPDNVGATQHVRRTRRVLVHAVVAVVALALATSCRSGSDASGMSAAAAPPKEMTVVLIGDSYTAGNGAGAYRADDGSYRSTRS
ncbi:MAG: hypothetical protein FWD11_07755, partial [Micrococcales bacterium]|nr:hypothetical protein [Micrococcales bacterium]